MFISIGLRDFQLVLRVLVFPEGPQVGNLNPTSVWGRYLELGPREAVEVDRAVGLHWRDKRGRGLSSCAAGSALSCKALTMCDAPNPHQMELLIPHFWAPKLRASVIHHFCRLWHFGIAAESGLRQTVTLSPVSSWSARASCSHRRGFARWADHAGWVDGQKVEPSLMRRSL